VPFEPTDPTTQNLCGEFTDPTTRDPGQSYSAPFTLLCEAPEIVVDGGATVVFVDGQPFFEEASEDGGDTGVGVSYATFTYVGSAAVDELFGGLEATQALAIIGIQLSAQTPPTGDDIEICLVDGDDAEIAGTTAVLSAGESFEDTVFAAAITLITGDRVRAKIKQVGSSTPGGYLNAALVIGPAS